MMRLGTEVKPAEQSTKAEQTGLETTGRVHCLSTVPSTVTQQAGHVLLDATTIQGAEASTAASGGSAACTATSGEDSVGAITWGSSEVVYAAQTLHNAIPIMGSASDRGISAGTGGLKRAGLGIPAARADTSGASGNFT